MVSNTIHTLYTHDSTQPKTHLHATPTYADTSISICCSTDIANK